MNPRFFSVVALTSVLSGLISPEVIAAGREGTARMWARPQTTTCLAKMEDRALQNFLNRSLGDLQPRLTCDELSTLTALRVAEAPFDVESLEGIQQAMHLQELDVSESYVRDLSPIAGMQSLSLLDVSLSLVENLRVAKELPNLRSLIAVGANQEVLSDISKLKSFSGLIDIGDNQLNSLKPFAELTELWGLMAGMNNLTSLDGLQGMTELNTLYLDGNQGLTDISALQHSVTLQSLDLRGTGVANLRPLHGLYGLDYIWLNNTPVADLTPLEGLPLLRELKLEYTLVTDLNPILDMPMMNSLYLTGTPVSDLGPVVEHANFQGGSSGYLGLCDMPNLDLSEGSQGRADVETLNARGITVHSPITDGCSE